MTTIAEVIEEMESKGIRVTGDEDKAVLAYLFLTPNPPREGVWLAS